MGTVSYSSKSSSGGSVGKNHRLSSQRMRCCCSHQVHSSTHRVPPKHYCGDPDDLKARISAANPTQELSLVEVCKRKTRAVG